MGNLSTAPNLGTTPTLFAHRVRWLAALLVSPLVFATLQAAAAPKSQSQFETPPVLEASKLLAPEILKGPYHQVAEKVTSDGYFNTYHIESTFGAFDVEGLPMLEVRISEMTALAELDKISSTKVFQDAALKAGKGIVMAPVNIVKKTAQTVSDPGAIVDTVAGIPDGAEKLFSWAYRKTKGAVVAVGDAVSGSSDDANSSGSGVSVSDTLQGGANFGLEYLGYNKNQRAWFKKLQINPYTTNQTLKDEVIRVAGIETAVGTASNLSPDSVFWDNSAPSIGGTIEPRSSLCMKTPMRSARRTNRGSFLSACQMISSRSFSITKPTLRGLVVS